MGQEGEVIRAERKMEAILCIDIFTYLIVFFDKAVTVYVVPQSKDKKRIKVLYCIFFITFKTYLGEQSNNRSA